MEDQRRKRRWRRSHHIIGAKRAPAGEAQNAIVIPAETGDLDGAIFNAAAFEVTAPLPDGIP